MEIKVCPKLFSFCIFLFLIFTFVPLSAQNLGKEMRVDSVLVSVNGEPVTLLDVMLETGSDELRLANLYTGERLYSETARLRKEAVEEIIVRKLVYAEYKRQPFVIEEQHIDRLIDYLAVTMGGGSRLGLEKRMKALGTTIMELRSKVKEKIAVDVLLAEFCDRPVAITPKDVYEYYRKNPQEWTEPKKYSLQLLLIAKKDSRTGGNAKEVCARLKKELSANPGYDHFAKSVKAHSDTMNSEKGGLVGKVDENKLRPEFAPLLKNAKVNDVIGPVETLEGYYFIRVDCIKPEKKLPFEKVTGRITELLEKKEHKAVRDAYVSKLKANAVIKYYF